MSKENAIEVDKLYTQTEICERLQLGSWAIRKAKAAGLNVRKVGRRNYIFGGDMLEFMRQETQKA